MQETWVWSLGREDPLEEEMAADSGILAWRIPWTEEPGGLRSMGSQRVGHDWSDLTHTHWEPKMSTSYRNAAHGDQTLRAGRHQEPLALPWRESEASHCWRTWALTFWWPLTLLCRVTLSLYTAVCEVNSQWGPTVQRWELLGGSLDGSSVWGRRDPCVHMAESFYCSPETITTLLISYIPMQN